MSTSLKERMSSYEDTSNYKLLNKLPLVIVINGRNFNKVTSLLEKPYSSELSEVFQSTMLRLCTEIDGCIFSYHYNDEIVFIAKNDQSIDTLPWYDNKLQKINSIATSIATHHFTSYSSVMDINFFSDPIFYTSVFTLPNIQETVNFLIYKQQQNFIISMNNACYYGLNKNYSDNEIKNMLSNLTLEEKSELLKTKCNIDFYDYSVSYKRGVAAYRIPKLTENLLKNKWAINTNLPIFSKEQNFLFHIIKNGYDVLRKEHFED